MRVIGCLSWHQESALWLAAAVSAASKVCDHIVAVDGAYGLFPDAQAQSGPEQAAAIHEVCQAEGMGLTLHAPDKVWAGNEVEKRSFLFAAAELVSEPDDWYFVFDADEVVKDVPPDFRDRLEQTDRAAAIAKFYERHDFQWTPGEAEQVNQRRMPEVTWQERRFFVRALRGLRCDRNHFTYATPDGRKLWGNTGDVEKALDLRDLVVEHRTNFRSLDRRMNQREYYHRRDSEQLEADDCYHCGETATRPIQIGWQRGQGDEFESKSAMVCDNCLPIAEAQAKKQLRAIGGNPDAIQYRGVAA